MKYDYPSEQEEENEEEEEEEKEEKEEEEKEEEEEWYSQIKWNMMMCTEWRTKCRVRYIVEL